MSKSCNAKITSHPCWFCGKWPFWMNGYACDCISNGILLSFYMSWHWPNKTLHSCILSTTYFMGFYLQHPKIIPFAWEYGISKIKIIIHSTKRIKSALIHMLKCERLNFENSQLSYFLWYCKLLGERQCVCVSVCVRVRKKNWCSGEDRRSKKIKYPEIIDVVLLDAQISQRNHRHCGDASQKYELIES